MEGRRAGGDKVVAQVSLDSPRATVMATFCRLEIGDTAGWKPALRTHWPDFVNGPVMEHEPSRLAVRSQFDKLWPYALLITVQNRNAALHAKSVLACV